TQAQFLREIRVSPWFVALQRKPSEHHYVLWSKHCLSVRHSRFANNEYSCCAAELPVLPESSGSRQQKPRPKVKHIAPGAALLTELVFWAIPSHRRAGAT